MRLENNFVQVENNPVVINKVNSVAAAFGWTVQNIQVTDSAVAYESGAVGWTTEFGTFVNKTISIQRTTYASITYQRDMEDSRYKDWVKLEREYNDALAKTYLDSSEQLRLKQIKDETVRKGTRIAQFLGVFAAILLFASDYIPPDFYVICLVGGLLLAIAALYFILGKKGKGEKVALSMYAKSALVKNSEYNALLKKEDARRTQARTEILDQARAL